MAPTQTQRISADRKRTTLCRSDAQARRARMAPLEERVVMAKTCKRCKATKSANDFYRNKLMADGLYSHCKARHPCGAGAAPC